MYYKLKTDLDRMQFLYDVLTGIIPGYSNFYPYTWTNLLYYADRVNVFSEENWLKNKAVKYRNIAVTHLLK